MKPRTPVMTKEIVALMNGPVGDAIAADTIRELAKDPATAHVAAVGAAFEAAGARGRKRSARFVDPLPHRSHVFLSRSGDGCARCAALPSDPEAFAACEPPIAGPRPPLTFLRTLLLDKLQERLDAQITILRSTTRAIVESAAADLTASKNVGLAIDLRRTFEAEDTRVLLGTALDYEATENKLRRTEHHHSPATRALRNGVGPAGAPHPEPPDGWRKRADGSIECDTRGGGTMRVCPCLHGYQVQAWRDGKPGHFAGVPTLGPLPLALAISFVEVSRDRSAPAPIAAPPPPPKVDLSKLIATVVRELRARGLSQVAYDIDRADDDVEIRTVKDLRRCVGRWATYLTDETRAAIGAPR